MANINGQPGQRPPDSYPHRACEYTSWPWRIELGGFFDDGTNVEPLAGLPPTRADGIYAEVTSDVARALGHSTLSSMAHAVNDT